MKMNGPCPFNTYTDKWEERDLGVKPPNFFKKYTKLKYKGVLNRKIHIRKNYDDIFD